MGRPGPYLESGCEGAKPAPDIETGSGPLCLPPTPSRCPTTASLLHFQDQVSEKTPNVVCSKENVTDKSLVGS